jgi:hypothetical protein
MIKEQVQSTHRDWTLLSAVMLCQGTQVGQNIKAEDIKVKHLEAQRYLETES